MFTLSINLEHADDVSKLATIAEIIQKGENADVISYDILFATDWYLTQLVSAIWKNDYAALDENQLSLLIGHIESSTEELEAILEKRKAA